MEYSERIDAQIAELLKSRNRVTATHLPGVPDEEGPALLKRYAELHGAQQHLIWDGSRLMREPPPRSESAVPAPGSPGGGPGSRTDAQAQVAARPSTSADGESVRKPSPVDEILAAPVDTSLLDTKAAGGAVPGWMWVLPLVFLLPGGILAWWLVRDTNRSTARAMLVAGVIMTVVTVASASLLRAVERQLNAVIGQGG